MDILMIQPLRSVTIIIIIIYFFADISLYLYVTVRR